jgi:hypothetical protein
MSIAFQCGCGKGYRVKPELAGKRVKCTACGRVLEVPSLEPQLEELKSHADPFAALPPLAAPLATAPGLGLPDQSPLNSPALGSISSGTNGHRSPAGVPVWAWIAAGGGGVAVLVVVAVIVAVSIGGNSPSPAATVTANAGNAPPPPQIAGTSANVAASPPPPPTPATKEQPDERPPEATEQTSWQTFQSASGAYSVEFPGQPQHREDRRDTPRGRLTLSIDYVTVPGVGAYAVTYTNNPQRVRNPKQEIERRARDTAAGAASGAGGKITETRDIALPGVTSKLYVIEGVKDGVTFQMQLVVVLTRDKFYNVSWAGLPGSASDDEVVKFMTSFRSNSN